MDTIRSDGVDDEARSAVESLTTAPFTTRFVRTDCNAPDPDWTTDDGRPIADHVGEVSDRFRREVASLAVRDLHGSVFHRFDDAVGLTVAGRHLFDLVEPTPRDLLHVYGPDRDDVRDRDRYYRYAWTDHDINGRVLSSDADIIRRGVLSCGANSYSGQNSYSLAGTGMFFTPRFGDARISIRPYLPWQISTSATGNERTLATSKAHLGIFVESYNHADSGGYNVDRDHWITVFSQDTHNYFVGLTGDGTATVGDGLVTDVLALSRRRYHIFVYAYLETSAAPQQQKNELRYVRIDLDATVPFVVVEETLI